MLTYPLENAGWKTMVLVKLFQIVPFQVAYGYYLGSDIGNAGLFFSCDHPVLQAEFCIHLNWARFSANELFTPGLSALLVQRLSRALLDCAFMSWDLRSIDS